MSYSNYSPSPLSQPLQSSATPSQLQAAQRQNQQQRLQQQQMLQRAAQQHPPPPPNGPGELVGDGNEGLKHAKKRKPTDRSLPSFSGSGLEDLEQLSREYSKLQKIERKLDWTLSRKKIELPEQVNSIRSGGVTRTLRLHLQTTLHDQPHQQPSTALSSLEVLPSPLPPPPADISVSLETPPPPPPVSTPLLPDSQTLLQSSQVDFGSTTGGGIPRFELVISSELVGEEEGKNGLGTWIKRITVETDRDPTLYDECGPIDWRRPPTPSTSSTPTLKALSISYPTSVPTSLKISLWVDHHPEVYTLLPDFAAVVDLGFGDRVTVLQALWRYVRSRGLVDEEKRMVRTDERLKKLFAGHTSVSFHHLPEFVNRFLVPLLPVVIDYVVKVDVTQPTTRHVAFDTEITIEDPSRLAIEKASAVIMSPNETLVKELVGLDEKIAAETLLLRSSLLKRSFLHSFVSSPIPFINQFISSQSSDLDLILSSDRGSQASVGAGSAWREEVRRSASWKGDWVGEAAGVMSGRIAEGGLRGALQGAAGVRR